MNPPLNILCTIALLALAVPAGADTELIPLGSTWSYLDDGSDQGTAWREIAFNASSWSIGPAELGYGDGDEATVVGYGGTATDKFVTTYFRKAFIVPDPAAFLSVELRAVVDDGAVFHINGAEVQRLRMTSGTISNSTLATSQIGGASESAFNVYGFPSAVLATGTNVMAVEVHQGARDSSDISFNLELAGISEVEVVRGPYLQRASEDETTVRWRSSAAHTGTVFYGESEGALTNSVVEGQASVDHVLRLVGLVPDTTYYYSLNNGATLLEGGPNFFFQTAPMPGSNGARHIWIVGDSGTADANAMAVYNAYRAYNGTQYTDLMLMLGDNAYNDGTDAQYQPAVFDMYPDTLRQTPLFSCLSNHDGLSADSATQTGPYYDIFTLPTNAECGGVASYTEAFYSFDFGDIHFICLDSFETARATNGAMHVWLEQDLAANTSKWMVAFWHHPPYSKGGHDSDTETELIDMRQNFLPLLETAGVDLVLSGHSHLYERSYLLHDHYGPSSSFNPTNHAVDHGDGRESGDGAYEKNIIGPDAGKGAVYVVAGSSGKVSGTKPGYPHPAMFISHLELGSVVMDVASNRMDLVFLNSEGVVRDSLSLLKTGGGLADTDGDGLPDAWEQFYFGNPTNTVATVDVDGDGLGNLSEYIAGTVPDDPASVLAFNGIAPSNGIIALSWYSASNRNYAVWRSGTLLSNNWSMVSNDIPATLPVNQLALGNETNAAAFYRVEVRLDQ